MLPGFMRYGRMFASPETGALRVLTAHRFRRKPEHPEGALAFSAGMSILHPTRTGTLSFCPALWGRIGFDGDVEAEVAGRGAAGLVKSGTIVIGNDYDYAYAA